MPYKVTVFTIFIASPSDVINEREIIRDEISEWNIINSKKYNILLQTAGWDKNVFPELGGEPQSIINKQILEDADLLIGIFWTKLGTPTKDYPSGSVEEIQKHHFAGKPTMLYFSNQPVRMDSVNSDEFQRLKEFKEWCKKNGIYEQYESNSEFSSLFRKNLGQVINSHKYFNEYKTEVIDNNYIESSNENILNFSEDERNILIEASKDSLGQIIRLKTNMGLIVQTNGKQFGSETRDPRVEAELEAIIEKFESLNLIQDLGYNRTTFRLTAEGYKITDQIIQSAPTAPNSQ